MSEFISLEKLKDMNSPSLLEYWLDAKFPFDQVGPESCRHCITEHATLHNLIGCTNQEHDELKNAAKLMIQRSPIWDIEHLRTNLEGVYALRLFYKHLYADNPPEIMDAPAEGEPPCVTELKNMSCPELTSTATTMAK